MASPGPPVVMIITWVNKPKAKMVVEMTIQELRDYIRSMPDDEVLKITIELKEDSQERDDRERNEAI